MATIYKRKNGSYVARIRRKGCRVRCKTFNSKTEAKRWAKAQERELDNVNPQATGAKHTLNEAIDRYIEEELHKLKPHTRRVRLARLDWYKREMGYLRLIDITPRRINELKNLLKTKGPTGKRPLKGPTVNRYLSTLGVILQLACKEWMWMDSVPTSLVRRERESRGIVRYLSDEEREALLKACAEDRWPTILLVVMLVKRINVCYLEGFKLFLSKIIVLFM